MSNSKNSISPKSEIPIEGYSFRWWNNLKPKNAFTAFKYPNYRLWFRGQLVSLFGTWMQMTAQGFLIFELTHSPAYLGMLGFSIGLPSWVFMMYAGVVADRLPRRTVLMITQSSAMILAMVLASLTFLGLVEAWHILVFGLLLGITTAFDAPARQAFVLEMVEREDLTNAIALNSTLFNTATAVGPAAGGIVYAAFGPAWCFTVNAVSFLAVIFALYKMKLKPFKKKEKNGSALYEFKEGFKYVIHQPVIRTIVAIVGMTTLFGFSFSTLIPAWAVKILNGDATTNGILQSARGIGSLSGALFIASLGRFNFRGKILTIGKFLFPALLIVFSFVRWLPLSLLVLVGVGTMVMFIFNMANALIQLIVPDDLRGRVMSIYSFAFFGFMPLGALLTGFMAEHIGEPVTIIINSSVLICFSLFVFLKVPKLRNQK
ncbi:MFS transporter [Bacteroidota bacterium]